MIKTLFYATNHFIDVRFLEVFCFRNEYVLHIRGFTYFRFMLDNDLYSNNLKRNYSLKTLQRNTHLYLLCYEININDLNEVTFL